MNCTHDKMFEKCCFVLHVLQNKWHLAKDRGPGVGKCHFSPFTQFHENKGNLL